MNTGTALPFTKQEFDAIYSKVPRLCVELLIKNSDGDILLVKRSIEPCVGQWTLPGGTVFFGEALIDAVKRIGSRELGIDVIAATSSNYIEYPSHYLHGLDSPVGLVFEISNYEGEPKLNNEANEFGWFHKVPDNMHADQDKFLIAREYLQL